MGQLSAASTPVLVLKVALDLPSYVNMQATSREGEDLLFDYSWSAEARPGQRVLVPFGTQDVIGMVVAKGPSAVPQDKLRAARAVLEDIAPLSPAWLELMRFAAGYYQRSLGEVALPALPSLLRRALGYRLNKDGALQSRSVNKLVRDSARWAEREAQAASVAPCLNSQQNDAAQAICLALEHKAFAPFLLHGVTGSGKTEVYLNAIAKVLAQGQQALVLVPEINLAPPLEALLRSRFGDRAVAAMHSGMADAERATNWLACHEQHASILVGTRMAVMASLPRLALIVVDEEHDASFKQQEGLRYSARDLAVMRASQAAIPVVLGSATPSLESWYLAQRKRYRLLSLPARAIEAAALPSIECVSTLRASLEHGFAPALKEAIARRLAAKEQVLVFVNRRGYAPVVSCSACGWISDCPQCSAHAVFHKTDGRLHCHHCGWQARVPRSCPSCGNSDLAPLGRGTQRIEETLSAWFPSARVERLDRDASQKKGHARAILQAFHDGAIDILVGTQMLAKGHDFKNLTLVCVLEADSALYSSDFRAPERLFANLAQVSGRAGRGDKPGLVLVQSDFVDHPLFAALKAHDYAGFAQKLLAEREQAQLPPYSYQVILRAETRQLAHAIEFLTEAKVLAEAQIGDASIAVYDPVPMTLMRKANSERAQLLIEAGSRPALQRLLPALNGALRALKWRGAWHMEVDPLEL